jgi:hypothetical protein
MRDARTSLSDSFSRVSALAQRGRGTVVLSLQLVHRRFDQQLGGHQRLAGAVVQLTREVGALVFLGLHHLACKQPQLRIGHAVLAQVEPQAADTDDGNAAERDAGDPQQRGLDVGRTPAIDLRHGGVDVVEVQPGAHHPVPARQGDHVAELGTSCPVEGLRHR